MSRFLVIKLSSLGDLFHALPSVRMVRNGLDATIDWVVQSGYEEVVRCFLDVDRVVPFPRKAFLRNAGAYLRELRAREYDVVLDMQGLLKSAALAARLARAPRRVGPSNHREGARLFYTDVAGPGSRNRHAVEQLFDVVRRLGLDVGEPVFPVRFPSVPCNEPHPRVAIVPCSRWPAKNWAPAAFAEVARSLHEQLSASITILGGPDERDVCRAVEEAAGEGRVTNLCGRTSLVEMGGWLAEMDLVISVDSGPMHMAAALGVPVLAVFGATDPGRTGPYGKAHRVVMAPELREDPDLARAYRRTSSVGAWHVEPEEVTREAFDMLA